MRDLEVQSVKDAAELIFNVEFLSPYDGSKTQRQLLRVRTEWLVSRFMPGLEVDADDGSKVADHIRDEVEALKQLTWLYVINRPGLADVQTGQRRVIEVLFEHYSEAAANPNGLRQFPALERDMIE